MRAVYNFGFCPLRGFRQTGIFQIFLSSGISTFKCIAGAL
jgi:hypothetical protein